MECEEPEEEEETGIKEADGTKPVFVHKLIRKEGRKNTNVPKFFVRIFIKYFKRYNPEQVSPELLKHFYKVERELTSRSTNDYNISDLLRLLRNENRELESFNRRLMMQTLASKIHQEVLGNKYISANQKTYLMASKVFASRCRSRRLIKRVQYR